MLARIFTKPSEYLCAENKNSGKIKECHPLATGEDKSHKNNVFPLLSSLGNVCAGTYLYVCMHPDGWCPVGVKTPDGPYRPKENGKL